MPCPTPKYTDAKGNESGSELQHKTQRIYKTASTRLSTHRSSMKGVLPLANTKGSYYLTLRSERALSGQLRRATTRYRQEPRAYPRHPERASCLVVPATCRTIANASRTQLIAPPRPPHPSTPYLLTGRGYSPSTFREYKGELPRTRIPGSWVNKSTAGSHERGVRVGMLDLAGFLLEHP
jgi:hypothetical protein